MKWKIQFLHCNSHISFLIAVCGCVARSYHIGPHIDNSCITTVLIDAYKIVSWNTHSLTRVWVWISKRKNTGLSSLCPPPWKTPDRKSRSDPFLIATGDPIWTPVGTGGGACVQCPSGPRQDVCRSENPT